MNAVRSVAQLTHLGENNRRWMTARPWIGVAARLTLGVVWIIAGGSKISDLAASGRAVAAYRVMPFEMATFLGAVLPFLEVMIGILLIVGLATRVGGITSVILLGMFIIGISQAWIRGLRIDCGCFGGGGDLAATESPSYASELIRDIGLVALAGFLALFPKTPWSLDTWLLDGGARK